MLRKPPAVVLAAIALEAGSVHTRMVEKHYGHLSPSYKADVIRSKAPQFGFKVESKVTAL